MIFGLFMNGFDDDAPGCRHGTHKWDGLHTRHLLESTHTNTHNDTSKPTHTDSFPVTTGPPGCRRFTKRLYINAPEGYQRGTHTNRTAYPLPAHEVLTQVHTKIFDECMHELTDFYERRERSLGFSPAN